MIDFSVAMPFKRLHFFDRMDVEEIDRLRDDLENLLSAYGQECRRKFPYKTKSRKRRQKCNASNV